MIIAACAQEQYAIWKDSVRFHDNWQVPYKAFLCSKCAGELLYFKIGETELWWILLNAWATCKFKLNIIFIPAYRIRKDQLQQLQWKVK